MQTGVEPGSVGVRLPPPACRLTVAALLLFFSAAASAEPSFARLYKQQFGYTPSCNACHKDGGGTPPNEYGIQFKQAGMNMAAWAAIAALDADGDGASNETEARARANPGNRNSTPANKGDWLDTASLIPREVQAAFPGIRSYLPRDAVLTPADIARAKTLGATLSAADENTIYIPLLDQKPAGTALIFPASHEGKTFFLLLVTDRQLKVTRVEPLNTAQVPAAARRKIYGRYVGLALDALPAASAAGLDGAIERAIKNAGTLIYVRLKNA